MTVTNDVKSSELLMSYMGNLMTRELSVEMCEKYYFHLYDINR